MTKEPSFPLPSLSPSFPICNMAHWSLKLCLALTPSQLLQPCKSRGQRGDEKAVGCSLMQAARCRLPLPPTPPCPTLARQPPVGGAGPLRHNYLTTVKWLQEQLVLGSGRQALLLEHMVKFGAISSEGTHITTIIMFFWHSGPVAGCLLSLISFLRKEKKCSLGTEAK